jgi:hypothetical protein
MKPINPQSLLQSIAGWIYDFQKDNGRLPVSLDDLSANKSPKHDYNPSRTITRSERQGYAFSYTTDNIAFTLEVSYAGIRHVFYNSP